MAISGNACMAYTLAISNNRIVVVVGGAMLRSACTPPAQAIVALARGEQCIVAGADMVEVRRLWMLGNGKGNRGENGEGNGEATG